jgi:mono/diheme cytochrome c family protein
MTLTRLAPALLAGLLITPAAFAADAKLPPAAGPADFERDVRPLFAARCVNCHNADKQKAGLRLDDGPAALAGGDSGAVIVPGKSASSRLVHVVAGTDPDMKMPPKGPALTTAEVGKLRAWIDAGAKWPATSTAAAGRRTSSHWAFQPLARPALPAVKKNAWVRTPIDRFVLARLEKEGIAPSPEADRVTLLRRLSLDLTGLPPTPEEVDAFLADTRSDAYERQVDRLLDSPHYGERWARHWLDAARYADSDGYEKDTGRPYAWRFRQWVIEALNRDLPFDRFTIEQLAGDLLPKATPEQKIATGFHRNTLTNREGGVDREQFRVEAVMDRVSTTGKVWLGVTVGCTQCHDHKYDPFTQREYYQFFAFFNGDEEVDLAAPLPGEAEELAAKQKAHAVKRATLAKAVEERKKELQATLAKWEAALTDAERAKLPAAVAAALKVEPAKRAPAQAKAVADHVAEADAMLAKRTKALAAHDKLAPTVSKAQTLAAGKGRTTNVFIRGDFLRKGVAVTPNTPAVLPPLPTANGRTPTRLDLAKWLVAADQPLTPRVTVNGVWLKYFGRGLVNTPEDFGTQGEKPSHPELLDWLAGRFIADGWSLKKLHRLIVTSAVYRQASHARSELKDRDPLNVLLARQARQRLEAETLRDNALAVSGLLSHKLGGPSVRPPQPAGVSELTYAGSARWEESRGEDRYRRGLYTWFQRTSPYPMMMTFDSPDSNVCVVRRERSNTPLQALTLLNDTVFVEAAQALGRRVLAAADDPAGRARQVVRLGLGREPSSAERERLVQLAAALKRLAAASPAEAAKLAGAAAKGGDAAEAAAWVGVARAVMNLDEFVTRE